MTDFLQAPGDFIHFVDFIHIRIDHHVGKRILLLALRLLLLLGDVQGDLLARGGGGAGQPLGGACADGHFGCFLGGLEGPFLLPDFV